MVWCGFKIGYQRGISCLKEIELGAQHVITILGLIVNIILRGGDLYDHLMSTRYLPCDNEVD